MTRTSSLMALPLLYALAVPAAAPGQDPPQQDAESRVAGAIDDLRGVDFKGLTEAELATLDVKLTSAVDILLENPEPAERAILEVLATERQDHFLVIDLAWTLMRIRGEAGRLDFAPISAALAETDPNAFARRFYDIASAMAWSGCTDCLPVVARVLELEELNAYIELHALPVSIELGILFTLGQYGDAAVPHAVAMLDRPECSSRANAATALGFLLPRKVPEKLREMARSDTCSTARTAAWTALGSLDEPPLAQMALQALAADPTPSTEVRIAMASALAQSFSPAVLEPLAMLAKDGDPEVATAAGAAAAALLDAAPDPGELRRKIGSASAEETERVQRSLTRAIEDHRLAGGTSPEEEKIWAAIEVEQSQERVEELLQELDRLRERSAAPDLEELLGALTPADLPRLNAGRASVLARFSDECLHDWGLLYYVARALRSVASGPRAGRWVAAPDLAAAAARVREEQRRLREERDRLLREELEAPGREWDEPVERVGPRDPLALSAYGYGISRRGR